MSTTRSAARAFALTFFGAALVLGAVADFPGLVGLAANSQTTTGIVTSVEPANHQFVHVSYSVEGQSHEVVRSYGAGFSAVAVGQAMPVHYLASDASVATLASPTDVLVQATLELAVLSFLGALLAAALVAAWRRRLTKR